jgi:hypothetical protein
MKLVKRLWEVVKTRSVGQLTRVAAVLALVALAVMVASVVFPRPLLVILAMSAGHVIGGAAFACYLLAVLLDVARGGTAMSIAPPAPPVEADGKKP